MSHLIYSTEALVLKAEDRGEGSRLFWLFTEHFGLVVAHAQGVRQAHSKLKHELQLYNLIRVSLVRGREWWRVVNVAGSSLVPAGGEAKKFLAEAADFLLRLIHGEGAHLDIFNNLTGPADILPFKAQALVSLGYLAPAQIAAGDFADENNLANLVNLGLAESQL